MLRLLRRTIEVKGRSASVYGIQQPDGTFGLRTGVGKRFRVRVENQIEEPSLIHWHGLTPPWQQDGVPGVSGPAIPAGGSADYDFPLRFGGTFWMHSHQGLQEQLLMSAPLIIRDQRDRPDQQEVILMLADFSFTPPEQIFAELRKGGKMSTNGPTAAPIAAGAPPAAAPPAMGAVAGCPITATFDGDASLRKRPMRRILDPVELIGARTVSATDGGRLPVTLAGARDPRPVVYRTPVPSAQIKSAVLLAGLAAPGETVVIETEASRDHTERLLKHFGADIVVEADGAQGRRITLKGEPELAPAPVVVPADPSSAAFPMVAALIVPGSEIILTAVMTR